MILIAKDVQEAVMEVAVLHVIVHVQEIVTARVHRQLQISLIVMLGVYYVYKIFFCTCRYL